LCYSNVTKKQKKTKKLKANIMKKHIVLIVSILVISTLLPKLSFAEKILFFAPTHIEIDQKDPVEVLTVTNMSKISRAYKLKLADLIMTNEGTTKEVDNFEYSAKRMIRFVPRSFVLKPGERQTVRVMARMPANLEDGEYHSHMSFLEDIKKREEINEKQTTDQGALMLAPLAYEAMIPVTISKGTITTQLSFGDSSIEPDGYMNDYKIITNIIRKGNGQGRGGLDIKYVQRDGTSIDLSPRRTINIYRELESLSKEFIISIPQDVQSGGTLLLELYNNKVKDGSPVDQLKLEIPN
jgi:hypothetical protein